MSKLKEVIGQVGIYTSSFALTQFVSVVGALIIRHFLGPLQTGVWSLVQVVLSYTDYANLGATYAIPIEIPFKRAQGKLEEMERMKNVMFSFSFSTSILFSLGIIIFAFVRRQHIPTELFYGFLIAAGIVILQQMNNVLISFLRAFKDFKLAGKQMALSSIVNLILTATLSSIFKLYGFMLAMILSFVFNIAYIFYFGTISFKWVLDFKILKGLIRYGFPLMVLAFAGTVLLTLDKMMIAKYLGLEALGLYSIAVMTSGFICSVPNSIGVVLLPNISEKFASGEKDENLRGYLEKSNHVFSILMPLLIGFAWFLVPLVIMLFIPKFEAGIQTLKYLAFSTYFVGLTQTYINCVVVSKKHFWQFPITVFFCVVGFFSMLFSIHLGGGINAIALIMSGIMLGNFTALYLLVGSPIFTTREIVFEYLRILTHFVFMILVLISLDRFFMPLPIFLRSATQCLALLVCYFPFIKQINSVYAVSETLKSKFLNRRPNSTGQQT